MSLLPEEADSRARPADMSQLQHAEEDSLASEDPPLQTKLYNPRQELERTVQFTKQTGLSM